MSKIDSPQGQVSDVPAFLIWDLRVRDRNLQQGKLTPKDVEKHLAGLPDLASQCEPVGLAQPALGGDLDDEDEDDGDDE